MSPRSFLTTLVAVLVFGVGVFFAIQYQQNSQQQQIVISQNQQALQNNPPIVQKTEAAAPAAPQKSEVFSPDGSMKVIIQKEVKNNANIYTFSVAEVSGNNE